MIDIWDDPAKRWQSKGKRHPLKCPYDGYANRFNIKPGFRWDGVIRGNGFENKYLQEINHRKANEER
jgi:pre-mRNA-splicing factor CWC26